MRLCLWLCIQVQKKLGYATCGVPYVSHSRIFQSRILHPCSLVPIIPVPHFPVLHFQRPPCCVLNKEKWAGLTQVSAVVDEPAHAVHAHRVVHKNGRRAQRDEQSTIHLSWQHCSRRERFYSPEFGTKFERELPTVRIYPYFWRYTRTVLDYCCLQK